MNNLMRRSAIIVALCLLLSLCLLVCSCGNKNNGDETTSGSVTDPVTDPQETDPQETDPQETDPQETEPKETEPQETTPVVEKVTYTVVVKNAAGEGLANVQVQLCNGSNCHPGVTNESGVATFTLEEAVYQANVMAAVDGYEVDTAKKYDFASDATSLEIVLAVKQEVVVPPTPTEGAVDLKEDPDYYTFGTIDGVNVIYVAATLVEESVEANDSVVYTYAATGDGYLVVGVEEALGTKVSIVNVTTGVTYPLALSGMGEVAAPTTAGNTYEVTVEYTRTEDVEYIIGYYATPDGSKEAPYFLFTGMVEETVEVSEGETVWYVLLDDYLLIEDATAKVEVNGVLYAPNAQGVITLDAINAEYGDLIGITSIEANDVITIQLTGSSWDAPLNVELDAEMYEELLEPIVVPPMSTVYICLDYVTNNAYGNYYFEVIGAENVGFADWFGNVSAGLVTNPRSYMLELSNNNTTAQVIELCVTSLAMVDGYSTQNAIEVELEEGELSASVELGYDSRYCLNGWGETAVYYYYTATKQVCDVTITGEGVDGCYIETKLGGYTYTYESDYETLVATLNYGDRLYFVVGSDFDLVVTEAAEVKGGDGSYMDPFVLVDMGDFDGTTGVIEGVITPEVAASCTSQWGQQLVYFTYTATKDCTVIIGCDFAYDEEGNYIVEYWGNDQNAVDGTCITNAEPREVTKWNIFTNDWFTFTQTERYDYEMVDETGVVNSDSTKNVYLKAELLEGDEFTFVVCVATNWEGDCGYTVTITDPIVVEDEETEGETTEGETTEGETTEGETTESETTESETTESETTGGETTGGEITGGEITGGEITEGGEA